MERNNVLGLMISTGSYRSFVDEITDLAISRKSRYVCVANVHMVMEAHRNRDFAAAVNGALLVAPDGQPLTWAMRAFHGLKQDRVAGMDLLPDLLSAAAERELPVYFYGGTSDMLQKTFRFVRLKYPSLIVAGMESPPFTAITTEEESKTIEKINGSGAALVLVILGCPKQEKWMASMHGKIQAVMIGVGGALPVLIGDQKRAPLWMQRSGLEWLFRLWQEPRRLFKRYITTNTAFVLLFCRQWMRVRV